MAFLKNNESDRKSICVIAGLIFLFIGLFFLWPQLDWMPSAYFFNSTTHLFPNGESPFFLRMQYWVKDFADAWTIYLGVGIVSSLLFVKYLPRLKIIFPWNTLQYLFLAIVLAIGPGMVINGVFKERFGRPRPSETTMFSGQYPYQAPFVMSDLDRKSFTSGHASVGFYFAALAFVVRPSRRKACYIGGILAGTGIGLLRVAQGRHYLSDVVFCGLIVLILIHAIHYIFANLAERFGKNA